MVQNIRILCMKKGITFQELQRQAGIGKNSIARWDTYCPSVKKVAEVARILGVTVDEIIKEDAET